MSSVKMPSDQESDDKMSNDKMSSYKLSAGKVSIGKKSPHNLQLPIEPEFEIIAILKITGEESFHEVRFYQTRPFWPVWNSDLHWKSYLAKQTILLGWVWYNLTFCKLSGSPQEVNVTEHQ